VIVSALDMRPSLLHLLLLAVAGTSCAAVDGPGPGGGGSTGGTGLPVVMRDVLADARQRSGDASARIASTESVTWRDGSLGCPQPDRMYTQALVRGWRLRVQAGGQELDYHASARGQWLLCPAGRAVDPVPDGAIK
jgi:hypothetical protein